MEATLTLLAILPALKVRINFLEIGEQDLFIERIIGFLVEV